MATQTLQNSVLTNRLEGKVAIVTGGDQGLGRAIALRLAGEGADIVFSYKSNQTGAEEVVNTITRADTKMGARRRAMAIQEDFSDTAQAQSFISALCDHFGRADILVNNAGLERRADFWEVSEQEYDLVLNVNLKAVFFITQAVVRRWMQSRRSFAKSSAPHRRIFHNCSRIACRGRRFPGPYTQ